MPMYVLEHSHRPQECRAAFAAWHGFESPLRRQAASATCSVEAAGGSHRIWWRVEAADRAAALTQLPPFVAERTTIAEVKEVPIP
ncbi:MAG: hypothetical protein ACRDQ2_19885 [Gaiellales bacterium]